MESRNRLRELPIILVMSALGGLTSIFVGYAGRLLSSLAVFSFVMPQLLAGFHVFWLILAAMMVNLKGSATMTGTLKGLIEASLFSHIGVFSFLVSFIEGFFVDVILAILKKNNSISVYLAGGFSSASNVLVIQLFFLPPLPTLVLASAYFASFLSGLVFGSYLATRVFKALPPNLQIPRQTQSKK